MENQSVQPTTPEAPTLQPIPPETPPVPQIKKISKALIIILVLLFLATTGTAGYFVYQNVFIKSKTERNATQEEINNSKQLITNNNPREVVISFIKAARAGDKKTARELLSPDANKKSFKATLEDDPNTPTIFDQEFTFSVSDVKTSTDGKTAYVTVELIIEGQKIINLWTLIKDLSGNWLAVDSIATAGSGNFSSFNRELPSLKNMKRVLLTLTGPVDFYLTSPEGKHIGVDPETKTIVNEIQDVSYSGPEPIMIETLAITDMWSIWNLAIVGNATGKYVLNTELVDPKNHQTESIEGVASENSIDYFLLQYPQEIGEPLKAQPVLQSM